MNKSSWLIMVVVLVGIGAIVVLLRVAEDGSDRHAEHVLIPGEADIPPAVPPAVAEAPVPAPEATRIPVVVPEVTRVPVAVPKVTESEVVVPEVTVSQVIVTEETRVPVLVPEVTVVPEVTRVPVTVQDVTRVPVAVPEAAPMPPPQPPGGVSQGTPPVHESPVEFTPGPTVNPLPAAELAPAVTRVVISTERAGGHKIGPDMYQATVYGTASVRFLWEASVVVNLSETGGVVRC